jgi:glycosyltransferase involved in cell wall biosynthesis
VLWFDVTELFAWQASHVTGVQRALTELVTEVEARGERVRYCRFDPVRGFCVVPAEHVLALVSALRAGEPRPAAWLSRTSACSFLNGDTMLVAGLNWPSSGYAAALRRAVREQGLRCAVLVYDLIPIEVAGYYDAAFESGLHEFLTIGVRWLTTSRYTAGALARFAAGSGAGPIDVRLVRPGDGWGGLAPDRMCRPARLMGIERPFVLFVSSVEPRKNHAFAFRAWEELAQAHGDAVPPLVCAGAITETARPVAADLARREKLRGRVHLLSSVTDAELEWLYRHCRFTIFPSLYEGWGLPVAESLHHGKVCVASNATSITEVGGPFADYHDPADLPGYVRLLERAIFDDGWLLDREAAIRRGYASRTWSQAAGDLLAALR